MILSKGLTRLGGVVALAALLLAAGLASAPSAHAQAPVPVLPVPTWLWGPAAAADSVIVASVDGVVCKTAEVDAATLVWAVRIDDGECGVASGSEITFTVNDHTANETVAWSVGGASEVTLTYDMGGTETPVEPVVETPVVETPVAETPVEPVVETPVASIVGFNPSAGQSSVVTFTDLSSIDDALGLIGCGDQTGASVSLTLMDGSSVIYAVGAPAFANSGFTDNVVFPIALTGAYVSCP